MRRKPYLFYMMYPYFGDPKHSVQSDPENRALNLNRSARGALKRNDCSSVVGISYISGEVPKIRGTILGVPGIRIIRLWFCVGFLLLRETTKHGL